MVEYVFAPGTAREIRLDDADIVQHNPVKIHTGKGDLRATVAIDRRLDDAAKRQDRLDVIIDGTVKWTGFVVGIRHDVGGATTRIRADGIAKRLEETRPSLQRIDIKSKRLDEAIRDYWTRTPFSATVTDQQPETVADDELVQSASTTAAFDSITSVAATDPVVVENGELRRAQSAYVFEGESSFISGTFSDSAYSDGDATGFDTGISLTGDKATYTFTPEYTIPESNAKLRFRIDLIDGDGDGDITPPEIAVRLNGDTLFQNQFLASQTSGLQWDDFNTDGEYSGGDLTAGSSVDIEIEITNGGVGDADDRINVDVVAAYDDRFSYNFDNSVDANGYLAGPELFPSFESVTLDPSKTGFNIGRLEAALSITDTSGGQAIDLSNDGGGTFTTAGTNTASAAVDFSGAGRRATTRLTLGGFGSRTTATPTEDFNGQAVSDYQLRADLDDLTVIDELELRGNHFDNLQKLHDYGSFVYVIEHADYTDESDLVVRSFSRGNETRPAPAAFDEPAAKQPEVAAENYFNSVLVRGRERSDGTRPEAEVTDSAAVSRDGRKITPGVLRDLSISTEAGAQFRANALLSSALSNNDLVGTLRAPPDLTDPGYARPVDFGDGPQEKTVERVTLSETGDSVESTFEFAVRPRFSRRVEELNRNQRDVEDQL
jgi:hypothetical protein